MFQFKTIAASSAALLSLFGAAIASPITVRDNPANGSSVFNAGQARNVSIVYNGTTRSVGAGPFSLQHNTGGSWTDFLTFCLELDAWLTLPKDHALIDGADYVPNAGDRRAIGVVFGNFLDPAYGLANADRAAAMQTVIWEIIEDGAANFDLTAGAFILNTSAVRTEANYLWALVLSGDFAPIRFNVLAARGTQDLLISNVPVPGALLLFGTALAGLCAVRRRRA